MGRIRTNEYIKVALAEDHVILRQGLVLLLNKSAHIRVVLDVNNGQELLREVGEASPDIVILDIDMPVMNGSATLKQLNALYPDIKVIMLSVHFQDLYITEFINAGARSFLSKDCDISILVEVIERVYSIGYYYDEKITTALMKKVNDPFKVASITPREAEIMKLLLASNSNVEISKLLGVSLRTVEWHRHNLMIKTGSKNLASLFTYALHNGLLSLPI
jgi:two-component system response regulator DegU